MACIVCGLDRRTGDSLVEIGASLEPVGGLCLGCLRGLKENRPSRFGCGFMPREDPCENDAAYATTATMETERPGDDDADFLGVPDEHLLCGEHFERIRTEDAKPPWL